jgi:hypothetical protein
MKNQRQRALASATLCVFVLTACAVTAPSYQPSLRNAELIRRNAGPLVLGEFMPAAQGATAATSPTLRTTSLVSPVGQDFSAYVREALRQELVLANRFDAASSVKISATLLANEMNAALAATSQGKLSMEFVVHRNDVVAFQKVISATASWDSSFFGAHAIGKARTQYPFLVQSLLSTVLADPEFLAAIKP